MSEPLGAAATALALLDGDPQAGISAAAEMADKLLRGTTNQGTWVYGRRVTERLARANEVWHLPTRSMLAACAYPADARLIAVMSTGMLTLLAEQWRAVAGRLGPDVRAWVPAADGAPAHSEPSVLPAELANVVAQCREFLTAVQRALGGGVSP